jgi:pyruvate/2-oxoglutarate dehydrogenase complex dihydrolipoamide acyltransferase (E2) component
VLYDLTPLYFRRERVGTARILYKSECLLARVRIAKLFGMNSDSVSTSVLPPSPVPLPPEGPPAISPRARKTARLLKIPLQALPLPGAGRRITERVVLAAARARAAAQMTSAARHVATERGSLGVELFQKLKRRVTAADAAGLKQAPLRCSAERLRMSSWQLERATAATRSASIPQITAAVFISAFRGGDSAVAVSLIHALGRVLADDQFRLFRAVVDRDELVCRGQINVAYFDHGQSPNGSASSTFYNVDRLPIEELRQAMSEAPSRQNIPAAAGIALVSLHDMRKLPVDSLQLPIEPGQAACITISGSQNRMVQDSKRREWILQNGWELQVSADARVIDASLVGFFIKNLKSFWEITSLLI